MKEKCETFETSRKIIRTFMSKIVLFCVKSQPNHILERSSPSTENLYYRFLHFFYCTTHCCEITNHERPELYPY